jgi:hypothetical protein
VTATRRAGGEGQLRIVEHWSGIAAEGRDALAADGLPRERDLCGLRILQETIAGGINVIS